MADIQDKNYWTTIIKPKNKLLNLHLGDVWHFRDLIALFVKRDFVAYYKQTILGPLWYLIQPLFTTVVFTLIFGRIAKLSTDGTPQILFYMSGIILWTYFSTCLTKTSDTFLANANIYKKVYFPRLVSPISVVISNLIMFAIQLVLFVGFYIFYLVKGMPSKPSIFVFSFVGIVIQTMILSFGLGILVSAMTTKYRDLKFMITFGLRLWMYATPIAYPLSQIPDKWQWIMYFNPMTFIIETTRFLFLGKGIINITEAAISIGMTLLILFFGLIIFNRVEKNFADRI